jgi:ATP-dependent protease HslVU (ClpYQ) peptidase subunit
MTLIVAGVIAGKGWIVSDTLITGGDIPLRNREYQVKCLPAQDRHSLVAFSGDAHNGGELIEQAAANLRL